MAKRWRIHPHDPARIADLQQAAGIPAVVAELLVCRGITEATAARDFLDPKLSALRDPELLPGCCQLRQVLISRLPSPLVSLQATWIFWMLENSGLFEDVMSPHVSVG